MLADKKFQNRIYLEEKINRGARVHLNEYHYRYLIKVLRLRDGDSIAIFNEVDGQWRAQITNVGKRSADLLVCEFLRYPRITRKLTLFFAPVKNPNTSFYVQKATELGVTDLVPIVTQRTIVRSLNSEKSRLVAIEAAEQCERFDIPKIHAPITLKQIEQFPVSKIFFCDEAAGDVPRETLLVKTDNDAIIVGPEGGFDSEERAYLRSLPNVVPLSLGENILRAETAMIAALAIYIAKPL
ncbi:MAG: 16S rRNA (uracil(1498)-N(3))-methyltransferase [Candidatus Jidaibacter sp.]|jgi:16S rRNA (uracil1498-N3)-methyltransferase|nr:16S rRNA (uracil(1498)-N(3))-methyltransferase [Candidatus Jidaibacter sp.]